MEPCAFEIHVVDAALAPDGMYVLDDAGGAWHVGTACDLVRVDDLPGDTFAPLEEAVRLGREWVELVREGPALMAYDTDGSGGWLLWNGRRSPVLEPILTVEGQDDVLRVVTGDRYFQASPGLDIVPFGLHFGVRGLVSMSRPVHHLDVSTWRRVLAVDDGLLFAVTDSGWEWLRAWPHGLVRVVPSSDGSVATVTRRGPSPRP